jgi:CTP synthase
MKKAREKIALFSNVPMDRVFSMHDCDSVYVVAEMLRGAGIDAKVIDQLHLADKVQPAEEESRRAKWSRYIKRFREAGQPVNIGITGKYTSLRDSYASVIQAIEHAQTRVGAKVQIEWIDSADLTEDNAADRLANLHGVIVPGGFGMRGVEGKISCVRYARENRIPFLGLCYGLQVAVIEFARHVCAMEGANSAEIDPDTPYPVIDVLPGQKQIAELGGSMRLGGHDVLVSPGTLFSRLALGADRMRMRFRHRYEVAPDLVERMVQAGMIFSGRAVNEPIMQVLELPEDVHPYFIGTQAHAELTSRPLAPHPFFVGLVRAALVRSGADAPPLEELLVDAPNGAEAGEVLRVS